ncbi:fimbria/pilus outer membrane usher protein [Luteibacter rhizovicinus]|uniref:fimbria/pilus outer membrane usher protein n=1 Tax=Luteibacter rhizovicinus TaxID=242606 RepID=UPI00138F8144|nr:fimbria/pilus outer membrane usher protein [Luteibacter rhizovicinus]
MACVLDLPDACANDLTDVEFDAGMLKQRGIDPKLAEYFRQAPRFTAGRHVVALRVNGRSMGRVQASFNETGALCVDAALLEAAEIAASSIDERPSGQSPAFACPDMTSRLPRANVELDPAQGEVSLLVPTDALRTPRQDVSGYARGGTAALLNYEVIGMDSRRGSRGSRYGSANTELGFNAGDWVVRSRQVATSSDGRYRTDLLDTYAQRSFANHRAVLQLGQLNIMNPALAGAQISGVQLMSEQALATPEGGAIVEGVASSPARVDVRQDGVLIYSTVVPVGPFALTRVPRINRHGSLDVTVVGSGGERQHFVVSPAMAGTATPSAGYSLAVGRARKTGGIGTPWVVSAGWSGPVRRRIVLSSGTMLATAYQSFGVGLGSSLATTTQVQVDLVGSRASRERVAGVQGTLTLSQRLNAQWSMAYSSTRQSHGFRELLDTARIGATTRNRTRYRSQSSASLSWSDSRFGNLSAGYSRTTLFDGRTTKRALASWATRLGRASMSLSAEWNLGHAMRSGNNAIYFNATIPLGDRRRMSTTIRRYTGETRYGTTFSDQVNEFVSYRAGLEYRSGDGRRSLNTAVSLLPRYLQLDAGYTRDTRSNSVSLAVRGGLVLHEHGLTASPYAVRDTFGVLSVGDAAGVRVSTPGGPVWTDGRGYAVLPQLSPYGKSGIEVATDSLPRNVDIHRGAAMVQAGRGAVMALDFAVNTTRRVLVSARTVDGRVVPFGATVTDGQGEVVGVVQGDGEIFVPNALATPRLTVRRDDMPDCGLDIRLGEQRDTNAYYESMAAVCRPIENDPR